MSIQMEVSCKPRGPGVCRGVLLLQFRGFSIGRFLEVHAGDTEVNALLQASTPYKKRGKVRDMFREAEVNTVKAERPVLPLSARGLTMSVCCLSMCMCNVLCVCVCVYIYIYILREREMLTEFCQGGDAA